MKRNNEQPGSEGDREKRGSVLLITVVLLLILAIMGTSFLFTTRIDRITSSGDVSNNQVDALVDGVRGLATSYIVNGMFETNNVNGAYQSMYRGTVPIVNSSTAPIQPPMPPVVPVNSFTINISGTPTKYNVNPAAGIAPFNNYDIPDYQQNGSGDPWLADRVPQLPNTSALAGPGNLPVWAAITAPLNALPTGLVSTPAAPTPQSGLFESPVLPVTASSGAPAPGFFNAPFNYPTYTKLQPGFMSANGQTYPALTDVYGISYVAGDADGDGVADCGLIRLPGVYADGLTYYAGIRIIDNNSAINVNTAWDEAYDYDFGAGGFLGNQNQIPLGNTSGALALQNANALLPWSFPSGVGLVQLLDDRDVYENSNPTALFGTPPNPYPAQALNADRLGQPNTPVSSTGSAPYPYANPAPPTAGLVDLSQSISDTPLSTTQVNPAPDYKFLTLGDAMYHQLSRRMGNPGLIDNYPSGTEYAYPHYGSFGDADAAALAYHFGLVNASAYPAGVGVSPLTLIEQSLYYSAYLDAPNMQGFTYKPANNTSTTEYLSPGWRAFPLPIPIFGSTNTVANFNLDAATIVNDWYNENFAAPVNLGNAPPYWPGYAYVGPTPYYPNLRPLLVTRNGVSNQAAANSYTQVAATVTPTPPVAGVLPVTSPLPTVPPGMLPYGDRGRWQPGVYYSVGDVVSYAQTPLQASGAPSPEFSYQQNELSSQFYVCNIAGVSQSNTAGAGGNPPPLSATGTVNTTSGGTPVPYWVNPNYLPTGFTAAPAMNTSAKLAKANVNTALFSELYRAYWNVMTSSTETVTSSPIPNTVTYSPCTPFGIPNPPLTPLDIYDGNGFSAGFPATAQTTPGTYPQPPLPQHSQRMFRSPVRDNRPLTAATGMFFDPYQVLLMRAAIAAVNTENLRCPAPVGGPNALAAAAESVVARQIPFQLTLNQDGTLIPVNVVVYGNQPQPFITEVYAQTDTVSTQTNHSMATVSNRNGYVAVEIYNPYSFPIPLGYTVGGATVVTWQLAVLSGTTSGVGARETLQPLVCSLPASIPSKSFLLLENYDATQASVLTDPSTSAAPAGFRPASSGLTMFGALGAGVTSVYVPGLAAVLPATFPAASPPASTPTPTRNELVLLKPRHFDATFSSGTDGTLPIVAGVNNGYNWGESASTMPVAPLTQGTGIYDLIPVDSFDFTGINPGSPTTAETWHYLRAAGVPWGMVYPGRYNGSLGSGGHQQGTVTNGGWNPAMATEPALGGPAMQFGTASAIASYPTVFPIQLNNANWAGPNKPVAPAVAGAVNAYPFGGFARNGDILEVPFIAAYRIEDLAGSLIELNSVTMDSAFAEDTDTGDDPPTTAVAPPATVEQIGRFCPLIPPPPLNPSGINDSQTALPANVRYGWARHLFDYLTVQDPHDDYLPNTDPTRYPAATAPGTLPQYPQPVANSDASLSTNLTSNGAAANITFNGAANTEAETTESVQGLININTAPLAVLESLPLSVNGSAGGGAIKSANLPALAQAIVTWRMNPSPALGAQPTGGPFTSLFDLNNVPNFQSGGTIASFAGNGTYAAQGNLTIGGNALAGTVVPNEFDEQYLQINRLSNLITTRSDTFTVYIVVEGWQNAGTNAATLVSTRRAAFIVDRNGVTPTSRVVRTINVPNN